MLSVTDIVLQNPKGDNGVVRIKRGADSVLFTLRLESFRDLDFHFLAPMVFPSESDVRFEVTCENVSTKAPCTRPCTWPASSRRSPRPREAPNPVSGAR